MRKLALVLALSSLALAGCAASRSADSTGGDFNHEQASINEVCPYSGKKVNPELVSHFEGRDVAFCCKGCKASFDGASHDEKHRILAKAK